MSQRRVPLLHPLQHQLSARPRLFIALAAGALVLALLPDAVTPHPTTRLLLAWNTLTSLYLLMALAGFTILSSWAFTHTLFALHYAHDYYLALEGHGQGGLDFPGEPRPDYWDFLYFAFIIATSGQTADVAITSRPMRRVNLAHCILAFLFNTILLALTINIAASQLG